MYLFFMPSFFTCNTIHFWASLSRVNIIPKIWYRELNLAAFLCNHQIKIHQYLQMYMYFHFHIHVHACMAIPYQTVKFTCTCVYLPIVMQQQFWVQPLDLIPTNVSSFTVHTCMHSMTANNITTNTAHFPFACLIHSSASNFLSSMVRLRLSPVVPFTE